MKSLRLSGSRMTLARAGSGMDQPLATAGVAAIHACVLMAQRWPFIGLLGSANTVPFHLKNNSITSAGVGSAFQKNISKWSRTARTKKGGTRYTVGQIIALQDQKKMTFKMALKLVETNIEKGNKRVVPELVGKTAGNA